MKAISLSAILALAALLPASPASAGTVDFQNGCVLYNGDPVLCTDDVPKPWVSGGCVYDRPGGRLIFCTDDVDPGIEYQGGCVYRDGSKVVCTQELKPWVEDNCIHRYPGGPVIACIPEHGLAFDGDCVERNGQDLYCVSDAPRPLCAYPESYPCVDLSPACLRGSADDAYCPGQTQPLCTNDVRETHPCVDAGNPLVPCVETAPSSRVCGREAACDGTPTYPCVDAAAPNGPCLRQSAFSATCARDVVPQVVCEGGVSTDYPCVDATPATDACVYASAASRRCAQDADEVFCDGTPTYPCVTGNGPDGYCVRVSPSVTACPLAFVPDRQVWCENGTSTHHPCVDASPTTNPCVWTSPTTAECAMDVLCDGTPRYPCVDLADGCLVANPANRLCPDDLLPDCPTCTQGPVWVDCSGADCVPTFTPNRLDPYGRTVGVDEQPVGYATVVDERTVRVPAVTVVPQRDPTTLTAPVPYVPPQHLFVDEQTVGPYPSQRICVPPGIDYVCYTTPNVPPVTVGPYDLGHTPGAGGPVDVTVPGNDEVATPEQTVTTPRVPVGGYAYVGGTAWVYLPGGSVGPISQGGLEICAQGCPWPGSPQHDVDPAVRYEPQQ